MSEYHSLHSGIWEDRAFYSLSHLARLLFIYLFSNQRCHVSGVYRITTRTIGFENGILEQDVLELLKELIGRGFIQYDFDREIVWVLNKLKVCNALKSKDTVKGVAKALMIFKDASFFKSGLFFNKYPELIDISIEQEKSIKSINSCLKGK